MRPALFLALGARLPTLPLRGVLLALCLVPALAMALLAGGLGALMVHRTAERQAMERKERVEVDLLNRMRKQARDLTVHANLIAERLSIVSAMRDGSLIDAHQALQRAMTSLAGVNLLTERVDLIDARGLVLASSHGGSGLPSTLVPATHSEAHGFVTEIDGRLVLVGAAAVAPYGEHLGWLSLSIAFETMPLRRMIGTAAGGALLQGERLITDTFPISAVELQQRLPALGGERAGMITLGGVPYWMSRQTLPWPGPPLEMLLFWPAEELHRAGHVAVGMIVLSLLLVMAMMLPLAGWLGARLARRLRGLAVAMHELSEGRRSAPLASQPSMIEELRQLHNARATFEERLTEREQLTDKLRWMANFDGLTQLPNRTLFQDRLAQALAVTRRTGAGMALFCLDLDRFKTVNDTLGHAAGDALLREVAQRMRLCLREVDTVARLGGDEFAIILSGINRPEDCETTARRLIAAVERPIELDGHLAEVGVSIGIAIADAGTEGPEALLRDADIALYAAKQAGRGMWRFFSSEMNAQARQRRQIEGALRTALTDGGLHLLFQPQVALHNGKVVGAEALLRWTDTGGVTHAPAHFIPLAEDTGLIVPIGAFVLREACAFAAARPDLRIAVNVSPVQLRHPGFVTEVRAALAESGLPPELLELEVTETAAFDAGPSSRFALEALRAIGVRVALDDFGTGYSSLGHLRELAVDRIKIDRSFVRDMAQDPQARALVRAIVGMARAVGVELVGEGVETADQARALLAEGCREAQGYMFSKPVSAAEFDALRTTSVSLHPA